MTFRLFCIVSQSNKSLKTGLFQQRNGTFLHGDVNNSNQSPSSIKQFQEFSLMLSREVSTHQSFCFTTNHKCNFYEPVKLKFQILVTKILRMYFALFLLVAITGSHMPAELTLLPENPTNSSSLSVRVGNMEIICRKNEWWN